MQNLVKLLETFIKETEQRNLDIYANSRISETNWQIVHFRLSSMKRNLLYISDIEDLDAKTYLTFSTKQEIIELNKFLFDCVIPETKKN